MAAPPSFLQPLPAETDATDGDIVTFQVKVSSDDPQDPPSVSWWRCGESLRPSPGKRDIVDHGDGWHELILSNVTEEDEGEYECRAENGRGHNSSFGSLYYYREGAAMLAEVGMEGLARGGDGRQSGLLILIDDGSQTEESGSEKSNRKSMTVSEQMQGIIEDLTQSNTGSMTLEKEDIEEDQFNSDIEELDDDDLENRMIQNILGMSGQQKTASEATLVPEMPSPDPQVDVAFSEGASDPYGGGQRPAPPHKWSSNPNHTRKRRKERTKEQMEETVWPPEAGPFEFPADTLTTSVELPFIATSTEEGAVKSSVRCAGAETPFDVADITEEAVDPDSLRMSPADGTTTVSVSPAKGVSSVASSQPCVDSRAESTLTSVTDLSALRESCQQHPSSVGGKMAFVRSTTVKSSTSATYRQQDDGATSISSMTTMDSSSFHKMSRTADDLEGSVSMSVKRTKVSSAYEADESSNRSAIHSESFFADTLMEHPHRVGRKYRIY